MANKNYYYVLVCSESGPKFVTKRVCTMAYWNEDEKPQSLTKSIANEIVSGLLWNGFVAYVVQSTFEIGNNPYNYKNYEIKFVKKECAGESANE